MDLFIMLISIALSTRFEQMNHRLNRARDKHLDELFWYNTRMNYAQLTELVEMVDGYLSNLILLSSLNNLYFICFQLLNIFQ